MLGTRTGAGVTATLEPSLFDHSPWFHGLRSKRLCSSVAVTLAPVRVPTLRPLLPNLISVAGQARAFQFASVGKTIQVSFLQLTSAFHNHSSFAHLASTTVSLLNTSKCSSLLKNNRYSVMPIRLCLYFFSLVHIRHFRNKRQNQMLEMCRQCNHVVLLFVSSLRTCTGISFSRSALFQFHRTIPAGVSTQLLVQTTERVILKLGQYV